MTLAYEWTFGSLLWGMLVFFFWVMLIWMFIALFADILRRHDLSGWGKAGWLALIFLLPFIGILVYLVARPPVAGTGMFADASQPTATAGVWDTSSSAADQLTKLAKLHTDGKIDDSEYATLKRQVVAA